MTSQWHYLEQRPHPWRKQLYIKGRKQRAYTIWSDMLVNKDTIEETAYNWDLPVDAIEEVISYCSLLEKNICLNLLLYYKK